MPLIYDPSGSLYRPHTFRTEAEFEKQVVALADQIFGPSTIYVDVKKKINGGDIVSIPDGYVLDMAEPDAPHLYVVESTKCPASSALLRTGCRWSNVRNNVAWQLRISNVRNQDSELNQPSI